MNVPAFSCCVGKLVAQKHKAQGICWKGAGQALWAGSPQGHLGLAAGANDRGRSLEHPAVSSVKIPQIPLGQGCPQEQECSVTWRVLAGKVTQALPQQSEGMLRV